MCGILFANTDNNLELLKNSLSKSAHRGPDNTKYVVYNKCFFGFHRLAIHGLDEIGDQPLQKLGRILICNGEIYNYKTLSIAFSFSHDDYANKSDCEIILDLLINGTISIFQICNMLDGVFAFVTMDARNQVCAARDPIGVRPLFYGYTENKEIVFGSEMKNLYDICDHSTIKEFPPGS
jgi:asparagine synthase (glutamine-hydrolysing)